MSDSDPETPRSAPRKVRRHQDGKQGEREAYRLHKMGVSKTEIRQLRFCPNARIEWTPAIILSQSDALSLRTTKNILFTVEVEPSEGIGSSPPIKRSSLSVRSAHSDHAADTPDVW
jgi:hypothetical protein